jgi:heat shock protein HslJ
MRRVILKNHSLKKALLLTVVFALCGLMLMSVENCDDASLEQYTRTTTTRRAVPKTKAKDASQTGQDSGQDVSAGQGTAGAGSGSQTAAQDGSAASQSGQAAQGGSGAGSQDAGSQSGQGGSAGDSGSGTGSGANASQGQASSGTGSGTEGTAATGTGATGSTAAIVNAIGGKEWKLAELRKGNVSTVIDRKKLESDGFGDLFTINFADRVSGKGAPNRFSAPYQVGANNALTISQPVSTLMAAIYDPERIREKEYFQYLINVKSWKLNSNKLELYTSDSAGKETVLVYGN